MKTSFRPLLIECLRESGRLIAEAVQKEKKIDYKDLLNLVTVTDKQAERLIIGKIQAACPDHDILAEESGAQQKKGSHRWIIDPLDGTTNFAHGFPMFCVSIALEESGSLILGGVYDPMRDELFLAERGTGATLNDKPISVSPTSSLSKSLLCTGFAYDRHKEERAAFYLEFNKAFMTRCHGIRRTGTAALDLCYVAAGRFDGFWEWYLQPWDVAAASLIIEEAGGCVSDFRGRSFNLAGTQTLATNGRIHSEMVTVLTDCQGTATRSGAATHSWPGPRVGTAPETPCKTPGFPPL